MKIGVKAPSGTAKRRVRWGVSDEPGKVEEDGAGPGPWYGGGVAERAARSSGSGPGQKIGADALKGTTTNRGEGERQVTQPITVEEKVGRNDPCLCGSGNKYEKCYGIGAG